MDLGQPVQMVATAVAQEILQALNIYPPYLHEHRSAEGRALQSHNTAHQRYLTINQYTVLQSLLSIPIQTVVRACLKYFTASVCLVP